MDRQGIRTTWTVPLWLVWLAALCLVFGGLGTSGILDNNEGLYAEIPREMLAADDWRAWIIPHLNGLPYMEKPPLLYWLTALSFLAFGQSESAARLVPALSALACVGLMLWFGVASGRRRAGRLAAVMFISGLGVMAMSHVLMFDMLLTALLTAALMLAWRYHDEPRRAWLVGSYACLALALLAKGFVALILFSLVCGTWALVARRAQESLLQAGRKWFDPGAILVFLVIAVPWHAAASLVEPIFAWFYFVNEHVLRFLGRREPHDYYSGSWWYYLPRMAIYLFPWSFMVFAMIGARRTGASDDVRLRRMLLVAWLMPLLFFSISSAKANYYLVAVMPFAAMHLAIALEERQLRPAALALPGLLIAMLALGICVAAGLRHEGVETVLIVLGMPQRQFLLWFAGGAGLLALVLGACAWRWPRTGVLVYLPLPAWLAVGLLAVLQAMQPVISTQQVAAFIQRELPGREVYLYQKFEEQSSLPFYLKKPLPVVDARSNDLFWGNRLRDNRIVLSTEQFRAAIAGRPAAIVVMQGQMEDFLRAGLDARFAGRKTVGRTTVFFD